MTENSQTIYHPSIHPPTIIYYNLYFHLLVYSSTRLLALLPPPPSSSSSPSHLNPKQPHHLSQIAHSTHYQNLPHALYHPSPIINLVHQSSLSSLSSLSDSSACHDSRWRHSWAKTNIHEIIIIIIIMIMVIMIIIKGSSSFIAPASASSILLLQKTGKHSPSPPPTPLSGDTAFIVSLPLRVYVMSLLPSLLEKPVGGES